MKFPVSMLRDYVVTSLDAEGLGDLLTMAGFELEDMAMVEGDSVLDVKVMSNRGDGLSVIGLAREVLAKDASARTTELYVRAMNRFPIGDESDAAAASCASVSIETEACGRYAFRAFQGLTNGQAEDWMQRRLRQAGMRPISLLVDITNYVLLETGQPLHAFDLDLLEGAQIVVRQAQDGETLRTLDGTDHELDPSMMMICDASRPVAAAGIMGGEATEVSASTTRVLLESAHFSNTSVRAARKKLGLTTEASYRFERSVDPEGVIGALNRFAELLAQVDGGVSRVAGVVDAYPGRRERVEIGIRASRARTLLGVDLSDEGAKSCLSRLGMEVEGSGEQMKVRAPSWRPDLVHEYDLIEEIGRVHGYDQIPEHLPIGTTLRAGVFGLPASIDRVREALVRCGFVQCISHTMGDRHPLDFSIGSRVTLRNPHAPEMALLRDSTLPQLAAAAQRNGGRDLHLFEIGKVFVQIAGTIDESPELGIITSGSLYPGHWGAKADVQADYYSLKGVVEEVARSVGVQVTFDAPRDPDRRFHGTQQAGVLTDEGRLWIGTIGRIHPDIAEDLNLPAETYLAELDLLVLCGDRNVEGGYRPVSRNPAIRRDISIEILKDVTWSQVEAAVRSASGEDLERVWLFDVYEGKGIREGAHSLALALQLRRFGENLTDEQANQVRDRVVAALAEIGATLRQ